MIEISSHVRTGLNQLQDSSVFTDELYKQLLECCFGTLLHENSIQKALELCPSKHDQIKEVYASLMTVIIESVKEDSNDDDLRQVLGKVIGTKCDYFINELNKKKLEISKNLQNINTSPSNLVDCNWRLDYIIHSNTRQQNGEAIYYIVLTTEKNGKIEYLEFVCNLHDLQELSTKLKEILKHAEKLTSV